MKPDTFGISGETAVVLGGNGGIGNRISRGLAECGVKVYCASRSEPAVRTDGISFISADATSEESLTSLRDRIIRENGHIDILCNCVGGNMKEATTDQQRSFFDIDTDALRKVVDLNLFGGAILPAKILGKTMATNKDGGSIIFISSMSADRPLTRIPGYSASKAAVENFTRWLATDMAKNFNPRLRVNSIAPGFFLTKQNEYLLRTQDGKLTARGQDIIDGTPMGRFGDLDEITGTALWLCSDLSRFVTGTTIPVDGGFSAFAGV